MKKVIIAVFLVLVTASLITAVDSTYHVRTYADQGYSAGYVVNEGMTSVFDADGNYGISTTNRYQLSRRIKSTSVTMASAGEDTVWTALLTVPAGQTITVTEVVLSAHTEVAGNNDSAWSAILYYTGSATSALDTVVAQFPTDAESLAYDDTVYTMTLLDSVFTAGDVLTFWQMNYEGAATGGEGAAVTIEYLIDE